MQARRTTIGARATEVHFLVSTLGFSRGFDFWCAGIEEAERTYEWLVRLSDSVRGVPGEVLVLVDNRKAAVIRTASERSAARRTTRSAVRAGARGGD